MGMAQRQLDVFIDSEPRLSSCGFRSCTETSGLRMSQGHASVNIVEYSHCSIALPLNAARQQIPEGSPGQPN